MRLGRNNGGLFTPKQAQLLKNKIDDGLGNPAEGHLRFIEGEGITAGQCTKDGQFNLTVKSPTCVALMMF